MMPLLALLLTAPLLGSAPSRAVPPPPEQVAANCVSPTHASDMRVCSDPDLRALDARMRETWAAVHFASVVASGAWVEAQQDWFERRSLCAFSERHDDCLHDAYLERIAVLEALRWVGSRPQHPGVAAVCADAPWGRAAVRMRAPVSGTLAFEDVDAGVLAVATPLRAVSPWKPYVGFDAEGGAVRLVPMNGQAFACVPGEPR